MSAGIVQISSLDELLNYAVSVKEGNADWKDAEILPNCATVSIRVCGAGWNKFIDARGAKYIVDFQKSLDTLYAKYPGQLPQKAPLVKVELREGSNLLLAWLTPIATELINKMDPQDALQVLKWVILCPTGVWGICKGAGLLVSRLNKKTDLEIAKLENEKQVKLAEIEKEKQKDLLSATSETQVKTLETLCRVVDRIEENTPPNPVADAVFTQPIRDYTRGLADDDRISSQELPPIKVKEVRPFLKAARRPKSRKRLVACDGLFNCMGLNLQRPEPRLVIEQDGVERLALISRLEKQDREELLSRVDKRLATQKMPFEIQLQLDVYFNEHEIKWCSIVGYGEPRKDIPMYGLDEIPHGVTDYMEAES